MQQPTGGSPRTDAAGTPRDKAPAKSPLHRLTGRVTRARRDRKRSRAAGVGTSLGATLRPLTSAERALPIAVAAIVAVAALLAFLPVTPQGTVAGIQGSTATPRLAVNGGISHDEALATALGALNAANAAAGIDGNTAARTADPSFGQVVLPETQVQEPSPAPTEPNQPPAAVIAPSAARSATPVAINPLANDGTIVVGPAPDTRVEDGKDLIRSYTVQKGDTLRSIAKKFGISSKALWWANRKQQKVKNGQIIV